MDIVSPSSKYKSSYIEYIKELGDEVRYPFTLGFDYENFDALLVKLDDFANGENLPEGKVPSTTLWLIKDQEIIGVTNIRHFLNSDIEYCGGHIGLGIRPSYRGQNFGSLLMKESIDVLHKMGVSNIHIHCHKTNLPSAFTIINNGGELDSEIVLNDGIVQRYIVNNIG
ncbi:GNAT family N-acetyltransferase [uncultured Psychromonas sp.]|uniref:GNAT family N-acetyltransferase n=1 Tax=uncultured Psychromonas sp. TaxID=173974 RepID=UPI00261CBCC4|nr:GNAT family N-acetyltransferase [uncultured Psychromonas sp.]